MTSGVGLTAPQATRAHPNACFVLEVLSKCPGHILEFHHRRIENIVIQ